MNHLDQIYSETVEDALKAVYAMIRQVQNAQREHLHGHKHCYQMVIIAFLISSYVMKCDKFHSDAEKRMSKEVKDYKPKEGFDPKKVDHYCEQLKTHLQEKLREEDSQLKEHWTSLAIGIVQSLCGMRTTLLLWH